MQDTPLSVLGKPWLSGNPSAADLWSACELNDGASAKQALEAALRHSVLARALQPSSRSVAAQIDELWQRMQEGSAGDWEPMLTRLREFGAALADADCEYRQLHEIVALVRNDITPRLVASFASEPARLLGVTTTLQQCLDHGLLIVAEQYLRAREGRSSSQRLQAEEALRVSERRFTTLFDAGLIGILVCDLSGTILEANDAFLEMVGYTRDEIMSGAVRWSEMTPPEWRHLDDDAIEQLKATGVARTWEKEYIRKDGSRVPILVGVAMLGAVDCIAFALDISERRRLDALRIRSAELEAQNRRVQESSRLKNEFLANMSHELRTPLNSIIGFADMLCDGEVPSDSPKHQEFLASILKSGRHLLQLINDVLDLAKVEAGKFEFQPEPVDLTQLITEVAAVIRSIAASKQIRIEIDVDPAVNNVCIDPARTKQVLYNYASNALKFTPEAGRVTVRVRAEGADMFRLEVEDTGIGIAAKDLGRLFVEFQQLDAGTSKRHAGTGLGLALTKRIVEEQGGSVGVKSIPDVGSVFFAILPRYAAPQGAVDAEPEAHVAPRDGAASILVVEDDVRDRGLLVQVLNKAGFGVVAASTGRQAIASCSTRVFDAITLDLMLPDITGLDVLHRVRTEGKNQSTPVLIVSVVAEQGMIGGFSVHDYLQKPVNSSELLSSLRRAHVVAKEGSPILIVDDDASALRLMESVLLNLGYRVHCRSDGESALAMLETERPAAIILDLLMPGIDGFEVLTRLRQRPENATVPVIIWTMKDLSSEDHMRLHRFAQAVVLKGDAHAQSLTEQLRTILQTASSRSAD